MNDKTYHDPILLSLCNWENLLEFYAKVSNDNPDFIYMVEPIPSIHSSVFCWPRFSIISQFNSDVTDNLLIIDERILSGIMAPFLLVGPKAQNNLVLYDSLEKHGIRQIAQWPLMFFDLEKITPEYNALGGMDIFRVDEGKSLRDWEILASNVLFADKPLPVNRMMSDGCALFIGYMGKTPVATSLAFFGTESSSAHMVAVHPDYRGKGYGKQIMTAAIIDSSERGYNTCYCQASQMGLKSWTALGFVVTGYVDLFWKVGYK